MIRSAIFIGAFQHTAARRRLGAGHLVCHRPRVVSTHSRPKAAGALSADVFAQLAVSTHSRPKAAGCRAPARVPPFARFNTQPPEGGWRPAVRNQPPERVSTHSRPKAAGLLGANGIKKEKVSTHSRPKAAGAALPDAVKTAIVSTHSRPKAAGESGHPRRRPAHVSTHSRPKAAGGQVLG